MSKNDIANNYFEWLFYLVCDGMFAKDISYRKLLMHLHNTEFKWLIPNDKNRAQDGIDLRYRFALTIKDSKTNVITNALRGTCSVLEMMVALAIRCEEGIMDDPRYGDRTKQWFWKMVNNLELGAMSDERYDKKIVDDSLDRFLHREYEPNGKGGLFYIKNCQRDLTDVEIWVQLLWYLDTII